MAENPIVLNDGEKILWRGKPEASVLGVWFFTKVVGFALLAAFLIFWGFAFFAGMWTATTNQEQGFNPASSIGQALKLVVPLCVLAAFVYAVALRQTYQYFVTNQRLVP